jgi:hypothetical protein
MFTFKGDTFMVLRGKHHDGAEGIVLFNPETNNEIVATMSTASLPKLPPPGCAWIRDFDEPLAQYYGITDALVDAGVISPEREAACHYDYVAVFAHRVL